MNTRTLPVLMMVALLVGCSSVRHTTKGEPIYFAGTREYQRKLQTLTLTAEQARERVAEHVRASRPDSPMLLLIGIHQVIVGDSFVFAMPHKKDVVLSGYYVDGHTGAVSKRSEGRTHYPKKT